MFKIYIYLKNYIFNRVQLVLDVHLKITDVIRPFDALQLYLYFIPLLLLWCPIYLFIYLFI